MDARGHSGRWDQDGCRNSRGYPQGRDISLSFGGNLSNGRDERAVVDPKLRVNGVTGLRVVDASVMPKITSANTNAATYMIAEKAAEILKRNQ